MALSRTAMALSFTSQYLLFIDGEKKPSSHILLCQQFSVWVTSGTLNGLYVGAPGVGTPLKVFGLFFLKPFLLQSSLVKDMKRRD